jgi:predicted flap endonuclease-1-like 5' DNA nuclease
MSKSIQDIIGIGPKDAGQLFQQGIYTSSKLLEVAGNRSGRKVLAINTSISESNILKWVNMCDLFRIKGVAGQFAGLLEGAGVATVKELGNCNAANLAQKMAAVNKHRHLCKTTPNATIVAGWIIQAKSLEPMVTD